MEKKDFTSQSQLSIQHVDVCYCTVYICLFHSLHSGTEGGAAPGHQWRATTQPVSHRSAQSAAFL